VFKIRQRKDNGVYYLTGTINGRRIRQSLETRDSEVARRRGAEEQGRIERTELYGPEQEATFADACILYLDPDENPEVPERHFLEPIIKEIGKHRLAKITPNAVKALAPKLYPGAKPQTWNRQVIKPVRAVINLAHENGMCSPIRIKGFQEKDKKPRRAIDRVWIDAFMKAAIQANQPRLVGHVSQIADTNASA
jgi:hypothetical protein